ncbi:unnamed protein product [Schistosoma margrebowiei]|uniref:Uncharacterized protein n=1 Tax=Schistosoma margrebowiei TaxID=48269 RepID=A0A3P8BB77_9TREM|nr:unnamed protein product [Schistosoma margrebowiei]
MTYKLLLYDLSFLIYGLSINYYLPHSQLHLAESCTNVIFYFMVGCGRFGWYINLVSLK